MMQNNRKGEGRTLYGPRTKDDIEPPVGKGWWDIPELCTKLKSMEVGADVSRVALTAIPTVWARPVLFGTALLDVKHRLHEEIVREWRGLLGVFCFQNFFNWIIRSHRYRIGEHSSEKLDQVLHQFTRDSRWRTIDLIYVEDILIGATSPLSLFFTPPEYRCPKRIPWVEKDGRLGDPTKYLKQMRMGKELGVLRKWIQNTKEKISGIESDVFGNPEIKDELLGVFQKWFEDIGDYEDVGSVKFISSILDRKPYQSASYVSSYGPEKTSDFFLDSNRTQDLPPIVITEEGWKQPEKVVYSPFIVDNIGRSDIPKELKGPASKLDLPYKGEYLQPKYLFTDRVLRIPMDKDSSIFYHEEGYVPPLRNEILDYFSPEELRKVFK